MGTRGRKAVRVARELAYRGTGDDPDDGSAGVREPRRPRPLGPSGGAGERPPPEDPITSEETQCLIERT
ncbi:hypothetical protein [Saccharothrix xinjiangensis]|uniref:Uncharacterized protein n=1 Tax=Saccharothrix xinjiangensis TaxID=204798 RepID=A0ABV9XTJ3_9PSEU